MDTITHSLLGALVVRSAFPAKQSIHPFTNRQRLPYACLAVLLAYLLFQGGLKQYAHSIARDHVHRGGISTAKIVVLPQPFSPFNWKIIIETDTYYDISYVNLSGGYVTTVDRTGFWSKVRNTYKTPEQMNWQRQRRFGDAGPEAERVEKLWRNEQLDYFRRFAELPVLYRIDQGMEKSCVWFTDLRYVLPYMTPPFRYGLCQETRETTWGINRLRN